MRVTARRSRSRKCVEVCVTTRQRPRSESSSRVGGCTRSACQVPPTIPGGEWNADSLRGREKVNTAAARWRPEGLHPRQGLLAAAGGRRTETRSEGSPPEGGERSDQGNGKFAACAYRRQRDEPGSGSPAASTYRPRKPSRMNDANRDGKELCEKAKPASLRWSPSGLATRPLSLAYSSKPVHNHPQEPLRKMLRQPLERDGPRHGQPPPTPDPGHPTTTTGTTTPSPVRTAARRKIGCQRWVAAQPLLPCRAVEVWLGCGRVAVLSRNSVARIFGFGGWPVEARGGHVPDLRSRRSRRPVGPAPAPGRRRR